MKEIKRKFGLLKLLLAVIAGISFIALFHFPFLKEYNLEFLVYGIIALFFISAIHVIEQVLLTYRGRFGRLASFGRQLIIGVISGVTVYLSTSTETQDPLSVAFWISAIIETSIIIILIGFGAIVYFFLEDNNPKIAK